MLWLIKNKAEVYYCSLLCIDLVRILWWPANGNYCRFGYHCRQRASDCCNLHRGRRNKLVSPLFYWYWYTLRWRPRPTPCEEAPGGGVCSSIKTMPLEGQTAPSWWWCLWAVCFSCFASKKPSEWEFFIPAKTDLAIKLLSGQTWCWRSHRQWYWQILWRRGYQSLLLLLHQAIPPQQDADAAELEGACVRASSTTTAATQSHWAASRVAPIEAYGGFSMS